MKYLFYIIALFTFVQSCKNHVNLDTEKKALMVLHNEQRKAHMEKNVSLLLGDSLIDYIEVNRGLIKRLSYSESRQRFQSYFDVVDFIKWDDISRPIISFSDDGTMATSVVDKLVITKNKQQGNRLDTSYYAWLAVYKKVNGKWKMHRMGSTNK
jgi:hypothetical protein